MDVDLLEVGVQAPDDEEHSREAGNGDDGGGQVVKIGFLGVDLDVKG